MENIDEVINEDIITEFDDTVDEITVVLEDGKEQIGDVLLHFSFEEGGKEYITYTFNEKDENGLVILYNSIIEKDDNEQYVLLEIESDEEWKKVKEVMRNVIKGEEV